MDFDVEFSIGLQIFRFCIVINDVVAVLVGSMRVHVSTIRLPFMVTYNTDKNSLGKIQNVGVEMRNFLGVGC